MYKVVFVCLFLVFNLCNVMGLSREEAKQIGKLLFGPDPDQCIRDKYSTLTPEEVSTLQTLKPLTSTGENNINCFMACVFKSVGLMDGDGKISHEEIMKKINPLVVENKVHNVEEFINACRPVNDVTTENDSKNCEKAKLVYNCLVENAAKFGFAFEM